MPFEFQALSIKEGVALPAILDLSGAIPMVRDTSWRTQAWMWLLLVGFANLQERQQRIYVGLYMRLTSPVNGYNWPPDIGLRLAPLLDGKPRQSHGDTECIDPSQQRPFRQMKEVH